MASSYPGTLDTFTDMGSTLNGPPTHSSVHEKVHDAIEAIQAELGTDPAGASTTVKARLDAVDVATAANASAASAAAQGWIAGASNAATGSTVSTVADVPSGSATFTQTSGRYFLLEGWITARCASGTTAYADLQLTDSANNVLTTDRSRTVAGQDIVKLFVRHRYLAASTASVTFKLRAVGVSGTFEYQPPSGNAAYTGTNWMQLDVIDLGAS